MASARDCGTAARRQLKRNRGVMVGPPERPAGGAGSVALVGREVAFVGIVPFALMAQRGCHRRNSDLAVTVVEVAVSALGVLALLRRLGCVHCLVSDDILGGPSKIESAARVGRNCAAIRVLS